MNALSQIKNSQRETSWVIDVDGELFRWCILADDNGIKMHVQFHDKRGTLLVIDRLVYDPSPADWCRGKNEDRALFTSFPDNKVVQLVRSARQRGWRHDMDQQIFRM
jgi:hypothetical protein